MLNIDNKIIILAKKNCIAVQPLCGSGAGKFNFLYLSHQLTRRTPPRHRYFVLYMVKHRSKPHKT